MDEAMLRKHIDVLRERPVFIGGIARSGTTLLQSLLDGHPQLIVDPSESRFFLSFLPRSRHASKERKGELVEKIVFQPKNRFLDPEGDHYQAYFSHISYTSVRETFYRFLGQTSEHDADYLSSAVLAFAEASGYLNEKIKYWVEKTIFNEWYASVIFSWWGGARFIHVLRDPRDVYATWKRRDIRAGRSVTGIDAFLYTWRYSALLARKNQKRFGEDRYHIVHYENLTRWPESQIERIVQFLGIDKLQCLFTPTKAGGKYPWKGNSSHDKRFTRISSSSVGQWRESLTEEEVSILEVLLGVEMKKQGYQLETSPSMLLRVQVLPYQGRNLLRVIRGRLRKGKW